MHKLPRDFYDRDTIEVAKDLLGKHLVHVSGGVERVGRIVEVEAYLGPHDLAAHSAKGLTPRTKPMFGPPGHAYVYLIYGIYHCMNVVTQEEGLAEAVLLRGAEPLRGIESMRVRRPKAKRDYELMNGPGKICQALDVDKRLDGESLSGETLWLTKRDIEVTEDDIAVSPRIGVENAGEAARWPLRFFLRGNRFVSAYRNV